MTFFPRLLSVVNRRSIRCPSCETPHGSDARFCQKCGGALTEQTLPVHQKPRAQKLRKKLRHDLIVAIITILFASPLTLLIKQWLFEPPSESVVTTLMTEEVQAGMNRDAGLVARIYATDAVVTDAACNAPNQGQAWHGLADIQARYRALPHFDSLEHADPHISWLPDNRWATTAYVKAYTFGDMGKNLIHGNERWTFTNNNGPWLISSFTYDFC